MCLSQEEGLAVRAGAERESACINVAMHCAIRKLCVLPCNVRRGTYGHRMGSAGMFVSAQAA
jgi:hypothetical protein